MSRIPLGSSIPNGDPASCATWCAVEDAPASELEALGVFEDRGTDPSPSRQEPGPEIASTADLAASLGGILQQQSSGSPLWTAYATHELLHGNLKVATSYLFRTHRFRLPDSPVSLSRAIADLWKLARYVGCLECLLVIGSASSLRHVVCFIDARSSLTEILPKD